MENVILKKDDSKKVITPVEFGDIGEKTLGEPKNLNIYVDIPREIVVELGKARMTLREVLELDTGKVIELSKQAGESVDIYVDEELIAKGEVVVIDDKFGVRVTEIVKITDLERRIL